MKIDDTDKKIIKELKKDSRNTIRDLAKILNLRPSTVHQRILKLKEHGVIEKFTIKTSNKLTGENFVVFMLVSTEGVILPESALKNDYIKEVFGITGEYDLMIKMKFLDVEEFNTYILEFRKKYGFKKTITMVGTVNLKEEL